MLRLEKPVCPVTNDLCPAPGICDFGPAATPENPAGRKASAYLMKYYPPAAGAEEVTGCISLQADYISLSAQFAPNEVQLRLIAQVAQLKLLLPE